MSENDFEPETLWGTREVALFLNLSESWVYQAASSGSLPCIRIGSRLRFEAEAIRAWVRGEIKGKIVKLPGCR
jgi:excisionase family DNA binding protein